MSDAATSSRPLNRNLATTKPQKMLTFVARRFLNLGQDEWEALSQEDRKKNIAAARRAVAATDGFRERHPAEADDVTP